MRIAICDDDEWELAHLLELITQYQLSRGVNYECFPFNNGSDFLSDLKGGEYDLVLLDVLMTGINGIQVAQEVRELDKNVKIIFVSSSPEFAIDSYSVEAYHYLLKPIDVTSLFQLLDKAESELFIQEEQGFVLKSRKGVLRISFAKLEYVEVINKTVCFHLTDGAIHEVTATLADFEEKLLSTLEFLKPHRSYLVNLRYIQAIGANCIVMKNGHNIPVSRQRRNQVYNAYMNFLHHPGTEVLFQDAQTPVSSEKLKRYDDFWKILLVDDDPADRTLWADILRRHGCAVMLADNGEEALKLAADEFCDCVLLDVELPGEDGFSVCEQIRKIVNIPVIFLSCHTESGRQVEGFAVGGIDYITKDTPAELFWAKVETRIKLSRSGSDRTQFCYGPLLIDLKRRRVLMNGKELILTSIEFDLLWQLSERPEHIFAPREIFDMIWKGQPWDGGQMVQMHMSRLRRKLEKAWEEHHFIEAVWGEGYRFAPVNE